jgi:hypothetical protein
MKKTLLAVLFILSVSPSFAQKIRFSDTTNKWEYLDLTCCDPPTFTPIGYHGWLGYVGTSTIAGIEYNILSDGLIRDDTILGKVFVIYHNHCTGMDDSVERVLYDYNWHVGDTVRQPNYCGANPVCWVTGIDSTLINSLWYKVWHFEGTFSGSTSVLLNYHIIEGIGCTNGPLYPINPYPYFEYSEQLFCFKSQGMSYPLSHSVPSWGLLGDIYFDNSTSCLLPLSSNKLSKINANVIVSPNPIDRSTKILLPYAISSGNLIITNTLGQTIISTSFQNKNELPIGDKIKQRGVYFFRAVDNETNNVYSGKFVY